MTEKIALYNGHIESATRSLLVLEELRPRRLSIDELHVTDLMVVFAEDFGGPHSLHAAILGRMNAYGFREKTIRSGLELLIELGLVTMTDDARFISTGLPTVLNHLGGCFYLERMRRNARWIASRIEETGTKAFLEASESSIIDAMLNGPCEMPATQKERFDGLRDIYLSDLDRMAGLNEAAVVYGFVATGRTLDLMDETADAAMKETASIRRHLKHLNDVISEDEAASPTPS